MNGRPVAAPRLREVLAEPGNQLVAVDVDTDVLPGILPVITGLGAGRTSECKQGKRCCNTQDRSFHCSESLCSAQRGDGYVFWSTGCHACRRHSRHPVVRCLPAKISGQLCISYPMFDSIPNFFGDSVTGVTAQWPGPGNRGGAPQPQLPPVGCSCGTRTDYGAKSTALDTGEDDCMQPARRLPGPGRRLQWPAGPPTAVTDMARGHLLKMPAGLCVSEPAVRRGYDGHATLQPLACRARAGLRPVLRTNRP